jgi:hypothetical protein
MEIDVDRTIEAGRRSSRGGRGRMTTEGQFGGPTAGTTTVRQASSLCATNHDTLGGRERIALPGGPSGRPAEDVDLDVVRVR